MPKVTRIHLPNRYRDTSGVLIERGEYNISDEALHGKGQYLVDNRHAFVIESVDEPGPVEVDDTEEDDSDEADTDGSPRSRRTRSKK